jgi:hypothetical protein
MNPLVTKLASQLKSHNRIKPEQIVEVEARQGEGILTYQSVAENIIASTPRGSTFRHINEDGHCLFRAVAVQLLPENPDPVYPIPLDFSHIRISSELLLLRKSKQILQNTRRTSHPSSTKCLENGYQSMILCRSLFPLIREPFQKRSLVLNASSFFIES